MLNQMRLNKLVLISAWLVLMLTDLAAMSRKDKRKRKQFMLKHMHVDDGLGNLPTTWVVHFGYQSITDPRENL